MNITIKTKNIELTPSLETVINRKMAGLKKLLMVFGDVECDCLVEISKETKHHRKGSLFMAEGILTLPGRQFTASSQKEPSQTVHK